MYSNTRKLFLIPSYTIDVKETGKIDNLFKLFEKAGVFELIDNTYMKEKTLGGRPSVNRYDLFVLIVYSYAFRHISLRDMESFCRYDLRAIYIMENEIPSHTTIGKFYNDFIVPNQYELFGMITAEIKNSCNIEFDEAFLDGTKFEADANKYKFVWKPTKYHEKLSEKVRDVLNRYQLNRNITESGILGTDTIAAKITEMYSIIECDNRSMIRDYEFLKSALVKSMEYEEKERICGPHRNSYYKTDHDATAMCLKRDYYSKKGTNMHAAYNAQIMVCKGIIASYYVSQSRSDLNDLIPALECFCSLYGFYPEYLCADSGYGSLENYRFLDEHNI